MPTRKKLDLVLAPQALIARKSELDEPDFSLNYNEDVIEAAFILNVPEKTKPQWNLVVAFTRPGAENYEFFQVTLFEDTVRNVVKPVSGEQYSGTVKEMILLYFQRRDIPITSDETITPDETLFHVNTHRGSKDGLLYFLPTHIFFGFKKPLLLLRLEDILSISYSSITRLTFNIVIKYLDRFTETEAEIEFSIIDQSLYDKINRYVSSKQLHDDSMAEKRKAKIDAKAIQPGELARAKEEALENNEDTGINDQTSLSNINGDFGTDDEDDEDFNSETGNQNYDNSDDDSDDSSDDDASVDLGEDV